MARRSFEVMSDKQRAVILTGIVLRRYRGIVHALRQPNVRVIVPKHVQTELNVMAARIAALEKLIVAATLEQLNK